MTRDRPRIDIEGAQRAHEALLERISPSNGDGLSDADVLRPSLLPGWTVGHVLSHVISSGRRLEQLFALAERGEVGTMYPGGSAEQRVEIEQGARSSASDLVAGLRSSIQGVETSWSEARDAWRGRAEVASGVVVAVIDLPLRRWREVEVHMGDLNLPNLGCGGPLAWSKEYVRRDVQILAMQWSSRGSMGMNSLPQPVARLEDRWRLAWLLGRHDVEGVEVAGVGEVGLL